MESDQERVGQACSTEERESEKEGRIDGLMDGLVGGVVRDKS